MLKLICCIAFAFSLVSCATIFDGSHQLVKITSQPDSARVEIDGISQGYTPLTISLKKRLDKPTVSLVRNGYQTKDFQLQTSVDGVTFVNLLFWPGFLIDLATGAIVKYDPPFYNIQMDKKEK